MSCSGSSPIWLLLLLLSACCGGLSEARLLINLHGLSLRCSPSTTLHCGRSLCCSPCLCNA